MNKNFSKLPLRTGVGIILLNDENKVFVARRIDNSKKFWQMPQGGVDEGEDFLKAAYRELEEETSVKSVELIKELDGTITYELPNRLLGIIWKGKYKGQKQKWFLMKFTGDENYYVEDGIVEFKNNNLSILTSSIFNLTDLDKSKQQDLLKLAEEEAGKPDISDQSKYLVDQKIEVLRSLN